MKNIEEATGRAGIQQPLAAYRFRVNAGEGLFNVTANTERVNFDFVNKTIKIEVRQSVLAETFDDALSFAKYPGFVVDAMDGTADNPVFTIRPLGLKLESHEFALDYGVANQSAKHRYVFSYDGIITGEYIQGTPADHVSDPRFPTPQEAMESLKKKANS